MILASGVKRCRFCSTELPRGFWADDGLTATVEKIADPPKPVGTPVGETLAAGFTDTRDSKVGPLPSHRPAGVLMPRPPSDSRVTPLPTKPGADSGAGPLPGAARRPDSRMSPLPGPLPLRRPDSRMSPLPGPLPSRGADSKLSPLPMATPGSPDQATVLPTQGRPGTHLMPLDIPEGRQGRPTAPPEEPVAPVENPHALPFDVINELALGAVAHAEESKQIQLPTKGPPRKTVTNMPELEPVNLRKVGLVALLLMVAVIVGFMYWGSNSPRQGEGHPAQKCRITCAKQLKEQQASGDMEAEVKMNLMSACVSKCLRPKPARSSSAR